MKLMLSSVSVLGIRQVLYQRSRLLGGTARNGVQSNRADQQNEV
jgi:hypothetical protein